MNLVKAIEILEEEVKHPYSAKKMGRPDALKLGIEALKEVERLRPHIHYHVQQLLPGETEE